MTTWTRFVFSAVLLVGLVVGPSAQAAGLVISCDTETGFRCSNNTSLTCTADTSQAVCGAANQCIKVFTNPCTVGTFIDQFIKLSNYALTLVVVLAVAMLVYGGVQFLTAAGRSSKIDEGKRVIVGTLVGVTISFTAFVIVNFTIAAITGSALAAHNINPFGAIAKVFVNPEDSKISRAFNSTGQPSTSNTCYSLDSGWDKGCLQIHCADTSATTGTIHTYQQVLNDKGCYAPGADNRTDGCFGPATLDAVRRFQIAAGIVPTGQIDSQTQQLLDNPLVSVNCAGQTMVDEIGSTLPSVSDNAESLQETGCCIINKGAIHLYCANQVSRRTCLAQGGDFKQGVTSCATDSASSALCGFCADSRTQQCFQTVSNFWCTEVVRDSTDPNFRMTFVAGQDCHGGTACANGCTNQLLNLPP